MSASLDPGPGAGCGPAQPDGMAIAGSVVCVAAARYATARFALPSTPRSAPYHQGFIHRLVWVGMGRPKGGIQNPYEPGSVAADAWWAGSDEAHQLRAEAFLAYLRGEQAPAGAATVAGA